MTRATVVKERRTNGHASPKRRHQRRRVQHRRLHPLAVAGVGIGMLALVAVIIASTTGSKKTADVPVWATVRISGGALPVFDRNKSDAAIGATAPVVRGTAMNGDAISIAPTGRLQVVLFVAHWCPHCRKEVPALVADFKDHGMPEGVDFTAVSSWATPRRPNFPPARWLSDEGWQVPTLIDDKASDVSAAFGMAGTPFWVFLDAHGTVLARIEAELGGAGLRNVLASLKTRAA